MDGDDGWLPGLGPRSPSGTARPRLAHPQPCAHADPLLCVTPACVHTQTSFSQVSASPAGPWAHGPLLSHRLLLRTHRLRDLRLSRITWPVSGTVGRPCGLWIRATQGASSHTQTKHACKCWVGGGRMGGFLLSPSTWAGSLGGPSVTECRHGPTQRLGVRQAWGGAGPARAPSSSGQPRGGVPWSPRLRQGQQRQEVQLELSSEGWALRPHPPPGPLEPPVGVKGSGPQPGEDPTATGTGSPACRAEASRARRPGFLRSWAPRAFSPPAARPPTAGSIFPGPSHGRGQSCSGGWQGARNRPGGAGQWLGVGGGGHTPGNGRELAGAQPTPHRPCLQPPHAPNGKLGRPAGAGSVLSPSSLVLSSCRVPHMLLLRRDPADRWSALQDNRLPVAVRADAPGSPRRQEEPLNPFRRQGN